MEDRQTTAVQKTELKRWGEVGFFFLASELLLLEGNLSKSIKKSTFNPN